MNQELPLISIALCTYNGAKYLPEQLDSLLKQTYPNLELVIQDDCSTDTTWDILTQYQAKHAHIRLYRNTSNLGFQKNFETILNKCRGEWIAISDQDDIWLPEKIDILYRLSDGNVLVYHDSEFIDDKGQLMDFRISNKLTFVSGQNPDSFLFFNCVSGHSMMFSKALIPEVLPFPKDGFYDHWIVFVASHLGKIDFSEKALVKYRQHESNCTDLLGTKNKLDGLSHTQKRIERENKWLKVCADYQKKKNINGQAVKLYDASKDRMNNYLNLEFGWTIWTDRNQLLHIVKKNSFSRFFFALRHIWGLKSKSFFKS